MTQPSLPLLPPRIKLILPYRLTPLLLHTLSVRPCTLRSQEPLVPFFTGFAKGADLRGRAAFEPEGGLVGGGFPEGEWPSGRVSEGFSDDARPNELTISVGSQESLIYARDDYHHLPTPEPA
jgi:hypothetical protein